LFSQRVFLGAYSENLEALRKSHHARAVGTLANIMSDEGDGTAATKTARIKAANSLLDNPEARSNGVSVTVNNGVNLAPGIVIRLPADLPLTPLETGEDPHLIDRRKTIDHEPRLIPHPRKDNDQ
jgi:hypothetical protein